MVLNFCAANYIGWPPPAVSLMIDYVDLCRDSAIQASLMALAAPSIDNAKVQHFWLKTKSDAPCTAKIC